MPSSIVPSPVPCPAHRRRTCSAPRPHRCKLLLLSPPCSIPCSPHVCYGCCNKKKKKICGNEKKMKTELKRREQIGEEEKERNKEE
jgi:hypothetical protein